MALIKCPECGKDISDSTPSCPHCGYQLNIKKEIVNEPPITGGKQKPKKKGGGCLAAIIVFVMLCFFVGFVNKDTVTSKQASVGFDKSSAQKYDENVWNVLLQIVKAHNSLVKGMDSYTAGNVTELDFYDYCKKVSEYAQKAYDTLPRNKDKDANKYIDACKNYALYLKKTADSLVTYIESKDTKSLSAVKENITNTQQAATIAIQSRAVFLTTFGYTQEEVEQIANEAAAAIDETDAQQ